MRTLTVVTLLTCVALSAFAATTNIPHSIPVHPAISFSPSSTSFVASGTQRITLTNTGPTQLTFTISLRGPDTTGFSLTDVSCNGSLPPSATCQLSVSYNGSGSTSVSVWVETNVGRTYTTNIVTGVASISLNPTALTLPDDTGNGVVVSTATVTMSNGSPFTGHLTSSDSLFAVQGLNIITARALTPNDDGNYTVTITALP